MHEHGLGGGYLVVCAGDVVVGQQVQFQKLVGDDLGVRVPSQHLVHLTFMGEYYVVVILGEVPVLFVQAEGYCDLLPPVLGAYFVEASKNRQFAYPLLHIASKSAKLS